MIIYVAHCFGGNPHNFNRAEEICHRLQIEHPENCYISPLHAFSYLGYGELSWEAEMELCLDLLSVCDKLIVASEISKGVKREIELAKNLHMEVEYLEG